MTTLADPILELEARHGSGAYAPRGITLCRGEGARVFDADGREYLDLTSGHGVSNLGHAHPAVARAVSEQLGRLSTCSGSFGNDVRSELLATLERVTPRGLTRFFLCNSGTEAVEAGIKFAVQRTGRSEVVAFVRGFHGRTLGALGATWEKRFREPFEGLVPRVQHVPFDRLDRAREVISERTACVLVEVVQGEGGVHPASREFVSGLRRLCDEHGALLCVDEVQTGFGRTGRLFACEEHDLVPDVLCLGKAIGGGVPMGAACLREDHGGFPVGAHGSTFGGNPLACAAALAVLRTIETEELCERSAALGGWMRDRLASLESDLVREVRGRGLMIGVELKTRVTPCLQKLQERGVLALPAGSNVLRLLPPLVIEQEQLEQAARAIDAVLLELGGEA